MERLPSITELSPEAFDELKALVIEEYGDTMTDDEITAMGLRLLNLFSLLLSPYTEKAEQRSGPELSDKEQQALTYIATCLELHGRSPSVREVAKAVGYRSSRSGLKVINRLIHRGSIERIADGQLQITRSLCTNTHIHGSM